MMPGILSHILKIVVFLAFILVSYYVVEAKDSQDQNVNFYGSNKHDVTGDHKLDMVELTGNVSKNNKKWVKKLKLTVKSNDRMISVPIKSGFQPKLTIGDFNHDGIKDVFVTMEKHNKQLFSKIYSFRDEQVLHIEMPPPALVTAQFLDDYVAEISVEGQKPVEVDISNRQRYYGELGIYNHGKLNEATELIVDPYSTFTVSSLLGRGKVLSAKQTVKGVDEDDAIAVISTSWSYQDGAWKLLKAKVKPVKK
jgi:hypothetical protein